MVDLAQDYAARHETDRADRFNGSVEAIEDRATAIDFVRNLPDDVLATGYQNSAFLNAWLSQESSQPYFVLIKQTGFGDVLLPLERQPNGVAVYCGGTHANGNFPVGRRRDIEALGQVQIETIVRLLQNSDNAPDAFYLERQHAQWQGCANPFVTQSSSVSPNVALSLSLEGGFKAVLDRHHGKRKRKRQRNHTRKLETFGEVTIEQHVACKDVQSVLDVFFKLKAARFREAGICDVFAEASVKNMFAQMFMESCALEKPRHVLKAVRVDGQPVSVIGCTIVDDRLTVEFGAFDEAYAVGGPGDLLFYHAIEDACAKGLRIFDFGVGDEFYKRSWCEIETWHRDTIIAITLRGRLRAAIKKTRNAAVHAIKTHSLLWDTVKKLRKYVGFLRRC